jgi:hypothetical protein
MTVLAKDILKDLNRNYFDKHIEEVKWSMEKRLTVIMETGEQYTFDGEEGKAIYKQLVKPIENEQKGS